MISIKKISIALFLLINIVAQAQLFSKYNINMLSLIDPDTSIMSTPVGNRYSGCWGWYQSSKNKEYAICGSKSGTYFIDVTSPTSPSVCAFVLGKKGATWREMKTYQNYCYIASSDGSPNKFQIVDMQYLPDSVHVVHSSNFYFESGHTIWIDKNKMYIGLTTFANKEFSPLSIWSLANPTAPVLMKRIETQIADAVIHEAHDMYARNDTIYVSAGWKGLVMLRHNVALDTVIKIGQYSGYTSAGYNHSSMITQNAKYLMFCDEVPSSLPIHMVDIQNFNNVQPLNDFYPQPQTTSHNPYLIGNKYAVVSCYKDGLFVYDISNPLHISLSGYFDTYPQGGANMNSYEGGAYSGNWGAYPYLPSGIILANDMQNGLFVLNAKAAFTSTNYVAVNQVGLPKNEASENEIKVFPNPAQDQLNFELPQNLSDKVVTIECYNLSEQKVLSIQLTETDLNKETAMPINVSALSNGIYFLRLISNQKIIAVSKFEINR